MAENNKQATPQDQEQDLSQVLKVRRDKLAALQKEGKDPFQQTKFTVSHHAQEIKEHFDEMEGQTVTIAGRLMSKRGMGKVSFCDMQDKSGRIQLYARKDEMDEAEYNTFKKYDIGDIVGVEGEVFRTQRGEMSVRCKHVTLLSKSLHPLPEKFHGLQDKELRYRRRYVDLIMNPEVRKNFEIRSQFVSYLRSFLDGRGYMEVETPVLNTISGGATARPFITHHNTLDIDMYMRIATELHLKRLIVGGLERVYEIGRIFRNEGMDTKHNPEFTTVELYEAYADFNDMMDLFEDFLSSAAQKILGTYEVTWQGEKIDLAPGWRRMTMAEAVKEYLGVDFMAITDDAEAVAACRARAEEAFSKLNGSADPAHDFAVLAATYSDETDRDQHPSGYTFTVGDGTLPAACEEAAQALEEGQFSGVVEADDGFYLILRKPVDLEAVAPDYFDALLQAAADSADISTTRTYADLDVSRFYDELIAARAELDASGGEVA